MTRVKRRYLTLQVRGRTSQNVGEAILQELRKLMAEIYGDMGIGMTTNQMTIKWDGTPHGILILRGPAGALRMYRTCLVFMNSLGGEEGVVSVVHTSGSISKSIKKTISFLRKQSRDRARQSRLQSLRLKGEAIAVDINEITCKLDEAIYSVSQVSGA